MKSISKAIQLTVFPKLNMLSIATSQYWNQQAFSRMFTNRRPIKWQLLKLNMRNFRVCLLSHHLLLLLVNPWLSSAILKPHQTASVSFQSRYAGEGRAAALYRGIEAAIGNEFQSGRAWSLKSKVSCKKKWNMPFMKIVGDQHPSPHFDAPAPIFASVWCHRKNGPYLIVWGLLAENFGPIVQLKSACKSYF